MQINLIGPAAALATFLGVWLGHVSVRKIERETVHLWKPTVIAILLSAGFGTASFLTSSLPLSAICGIFSVTLFWDALEIAVRQPKRIKHGHAPANPKNPRHAKILAEYPEATTIDWLDRDPRGAPYSAAELASIKESAK
ncbi:MAG TPA: DUF4491 family protein [Anaerolineales bacterium]|nr:DUF4491 family protein [Anaerolineales bacterium]